MESPVQAPARRKAGAKEIAADVAPLHLIDIHHSGYYGWGVWVTPDAPERWTAETIERVMRHPHYKMGINLGAQSYEQNPRLAKRIRRWLEMFPDRVYVTAGDYAQLTACVRSGESNLRQILVGLDVVKETIGVRPRIWTMSEPGNFAQLPQVLMDLGYEGALLRVHGPGQGGSPAPTVDAGSIWWEGPDGTPILAVAEYKDDRENPGDDCTISMWILTRYLNARQKRGNFTLDDILAWKERMAAKGIDPVLISKDDDHNDQPSNNNLCMQSGHRFVADVDGDPRFNWVTADEFFAELPEPKLYFSADPNLFETRKKSFCDYGFAGNTDWNADLVADAKLRDADFAAVLAADLRVNVDTEKDLDLAWRSHLGAQNHDLSLKGSLHLMYHLQYETQRMADAARDAALEPVLKRIDTGDGPGAIVVVNPLGWARREYATVDMEGEIADGAVLVDDAGAAIPWEVVERQAEQVTMGFIADVPPLGYRRYLLRKRKRNEKPATSPAGAEVDGLTVRTPEYAISFRPDGGVASLAPARDDRSVVGPDGVVLAGDIGGGPATMMGTVVLETTAVSVVGRERGMLGKFHAYEIVYRMTPGVPYVGVSVYVEPRFFEGTPGAPGAVADPQRKIELSAALAGHVAAPGAPPVIMRKQPFLVWPFDVSISPIFAALTWVDYEGDAGLGILNRGAIGQRYDAARAEANVILWAGGTGRVTQPLGLLPHRGDWRAARVHEAGVGFGAPLYAVHEPAHTGRLGASHSVADVEPITTTVSSVFRRDGRSYVRLWEHAGEPAHVRFVKDGVGTKARRVSLERKTVAGGRSIGPRQIGTFRLD